MINDWLNSGMGRITMPSLGRLGSGAIYSMVLLGLVSLL